MVSENDPLTIDSETAAVLSGSRILVVMNDLTLGTAVGRLKSVPGAEVCPVRTVAEAVKCYETFSPDVVVAAFASRACLLADGFQAILGKPVLALTIDSHAVSLATELAPARTMEN